MRIKEGVTNSFIWNVLKNLPNFIGVIPQDYLSNFKIVSFPVSFVINLDLSNQPGSHWIGILLSTTDIKIYDSLSLDPQMSPNKPSFLLNFLKKFKSSHTIYLTPHLQPINSNTCGFYCIFFLYSSLFLSFNDTLSIFSTNCFLNDKILLDLLF